MIDALFYHWNHRLHDNFRIKMAFGHKTQHITNIGLGQMPKIFSHLFIKEKAPFF